MDRRRFLLTSLAGALAAPLGAEAQRAGKIPRIGFLATPAAEVIKSRVAAFEEALRELGYVDGKSIIIEYRYADGRFQRLPNLASELVFVGDEGTTEARGPTHRQGFEFAMRAKLLDWLTFSGDVTSSHAEFDTGQAVALAPLVTSRADLTARFPFGLAASFAMRWPGA